MFRPVEGDPINNDNMPGTRDAIEKGKIHKPKIMSFEDISDEDMNRKLSKDELSY